MPKHHPHHHHHGPHHHGPHWQGPAGSHQIASRLQEMRALGASDEDVKAVLELLKEKLPKGLVESAAAHAEDVDEAVALANSAEEANQEVLNVLRSSVVLIAGEMRPHLISSLLDEGVNAVQVHDRAPHGDGRPPHFRDLSGWYPKQFSGVLAFTEISDDEVTAILIDAFLDQQGVAHASPLAMMASRLWPMAKVIAVLSDHRAPHHFARVGRGVDHYLYWE